MTNTNSLKGLQALADFKKTPNRRRAESPRRSEYRGSEVPAIAVGKLGSIVNVVYAVRGLPGIINKAEIALASAGSEMLRQYPELSPAKALSRGLDRIVAEAATGSGGSLQVTRPKRVMSAMDDVPAVSGLGGSMLRRSRKQPNELEETDRIKDAVSARDVADLAEGTEGHAFLTQLDVAKVSKLQSLRGNERYLFLRRTVPDIGVALLVAMLLQGDFNQRGFPLIDLAWSHMSTLRWAECVLRDTRVVLEEEDSDLRVDVFAHFLDNGAERALVVREELRDVQVTEATTPFNRARAHKLFRENPAHWEALSAEYSEIHRKIDDLQGEAIQVVDDVLALVRWRIAEKEEYMQRRNAERNRTVAPVASDAPRVVAPTTRESYFSSTRTPVEAVAKVREEADVEMDEMRVPTFNASVISLNEVANKKKLEQAGLDGPRECAVYPGVVWEAVLGPLYHAMDLDKNQPDAWTVVIAPRRVGGMGVDMSDARLLTVGEYEDYFSPVGE